MKRAFTSFIGFSCFTFLLFGLTSRDNKYVHTPQANKGSAMFSLCGDSFLFQTSNSQLSTLAIKNNGLATPQLDTKLAERVSKAIEQEKKEHEEKVAPPAVNGNT